MSSKPKNFYAMRIRTLIFSCLLVFLLFASSLSSALAKSRRHLETGESLFVEDVSDFITSQDRSFTCGFYNVGSNAYWFAIWFTNSKDRTVVWMANRDKPVNGHGSKLSIWETGAMVLTDIDGAVVWQSNTISADISRAELLNTGNLVLKNPGGEILWQSFDFPTDTLLPSEALTKSKRLVSSLRKGSYASGYFNFYFDNLNVLSLMYDGPEISSIYWPDPSIGVRQSGRTDYNSSRIAVFDDIGLFQSSDHLRFSADDEGSRIRRRLTLDYDGNLRMYSLINSTGLWNVSWQAMGQPCNIHGICGKNGICIYAPERRRCSCPPGYDVSDPSDWSQGCKAKFNLGISNTQQVKFVELRNTDYRGFDLSCRLSISIEACKKICWDDFRCVAFSYNITGDGRCSAKSALFNGVKTLSVPGSIYLKIPINVETLSEPLILGVPDNICGSSQQYVFGSTPHKERVMKWVHLYSFVSALGAIECMFFALGWWFLFSRHAVPASIEDGYRMIWRQFKRFSYGELMKATKNFKQELGRGGCGVVYKGVLEDRRTVAVKRLGHVLQAEEEFRAEMSTIGQINHMNLVRMWGFCSERKHRLLVYEYVENSSLDKHLFTSNFLQWKQRFEVALGTARGLAYLHHECLEWVIHCDVKPENILLDSEFQPKISDFGLAKLSQRGGSGSGVSQVRGTIGYLAPEWTLNQPITAKVDVYSYGVVVLEMVKGKRLSDWLTDGTDDDQVPKPTKFVRTVNRKIDSGADSWVESIMDGRLEGKYSMNQAVTLIEIGLACIEKDRYKRPTMASIVQTLLECAEEVEVHNPETP